MSDSSGLLEKTTADKYQFNLALSLFRIHKNKEWNWTPVPGMTKYGFKEYVESVYNLDYGKANALKNIGKGLFTLSIDDSILDNYEWEYVKKIATIATSETLTEWLHKSKTLKKSEFNKAIREARISKNGEKTRRMFIKVDEDQEKVAKLAIELSKKLHRVDTDAGAMEAIFLNFITSSQAMDLIGKNREILTARMIALLEKING